MANRSLVILLIIPFITLIRSKTVKIPDLGALLGSTTRSAWTNRTIYSFRDVKFGKSPSGILRFKPPEPIEPWNGTYDATKQGISCPQLMSLDNLRQDATEDLEDCLSMNIFTPMIPDDTADASLLPVMIYYHGGGFDHGDSSEFPPDYLLEHNVLLIVPQYRLGPFGFLSLHTNDIPGNVGLMDQLLSLKWINKYVKHFGGDNKRVTVFGQSAGAFSLSAMLLSPAVEPHLFQQMIVQSGSAFGNWGLLDNPIDYARDLYYILTNSTQEASFTEMEDVFLGSSIKEILMAFKAQIEKEPTKMSVLARSTVQKAGSLRYLTMTPEESLKTGKYRTVPMLIGVAKHDGSFLLKNIYDSLAALNLQENNEILRNNITDISIKSSGIKDNTGSLVDLFNKQYFKDIFDTDVDIKFKDLAPGLIDVILGVLSFKAQTLKMTKANANYESETYLYTMDYRGEHTRFGFGEDMRGYPYDGGVHHSDDLIYLFPYAYKTPLNENDTKIAKLMTDLWTSFAINGKPTSPSLTKEWPIFNKSKNGPYLHLNTYCTIGEDFVDSEYFVATNEAKSSLNRIKIQSDKAFDEI